MNNKLLPALLLSIAVVAGTTTITDAFAQTNTEKLTTVVNTTDDTNSIVHMIMEGLNSIVEAVTSLSGSVDTLGDTIQDNTNTITSKLTSIESTLAESAVIATAVQDIAADVHSLQDTIQHMDEHLESLGDTGDLEATISDLGTTTNTRIGNLEASIDERLDSIESKLDSISENLGVVQSTVAPDPTAVTIPSLNQNAVGNNVIKASHYATTFSSNPNNDIVGWPDDENYVLPYDFTFSCDAPVLIDEVSIKADGPLADREHNVLPTANRNHTHPLYNNTYYASIIAETSMDLDPTTIKVNGRTLVDTDFKPRADDDDNKVVYNQPADFDLTHLAAGQSLNFKTEVNFRVYTAEKRTVDFYDKTTPEDNLIPYFPENGKSDTGGPDNESTVEDDITHYVYANLTNGNSTELQEYDFDIFMVNVDYISLSGSDAGCKLSLPEASPTLGKVRNELINLATTGDDLLKTFEVEVYCNDKTTRINADGLTASHTVSDSAVSASSIILSAGGKSMELQLTKSSEKLEHIEGDKKLEFDSGNLKISGSVPQVPGILLNLAYQTVSGNTCSIVTE